MSLLGLALLIIGLAMVVEQFYLLLAEITLMTSQVHKVKSITVNWWFGRAGLTLAAVGAVLTFG